MPSSAAGWSVDVPWNGNHMVSVAEQENKMNLGLGSSQHRQKQQQEGSSFSYELFYTIWHVGSL